MGGTARLVAWLLAVQLISGCVLTTAALVPARSQVEVLVATHDVEVRSVPDGAVVRGAADQFGKLRIPEVPPHAVGIELVGQRVNLIAPIESSAAPASPAPPEPAP